MFHYQSPDATQKVEALDGYMKGQSGEWQMFTVHRGGGSGSQPSIQTFTVDANKSRRKRSTPQTVSTYIVYTVMMLN